jgi:serine/threonine-protein kinase
MSTDAETRAAGPATTPAVPELKQLGKYEIVKKLGQGGMGAVYLARDTQLRRTVAIKVLPKDKAANPTLVRRFQAEAQAAAQLRHDHIVAVYDSNEADGYLYIAMEYVEGHDLHEMIAKRGTIPVKRSIEIIKQVASALQHAHEHKIVHRDIKPSNLLIRNDKAVKLTDLGLARSVDDTIETGITRAGTTVGTVDYMSPEQARNSKAADIRSDIYSLGCTWFQMLTGHPPYPEGSLTNKLQAHAIKPIPDPRTENPNVTEGLVAVIQRMMAKKPEDRYQTPAELLKDLEASALTRAAFSQEIFNAIDDEGGHAGGSKASPVDDSTPAAVPARSRGKGKGNEAQIDDGPAATVGSSGPQRAVSGGKKGPSTLPPPVRRKPADHDEDERPPSPWAERFKMFGLIGGVVAGIALLAGLVSQVGGLFDSPNQLVVQPVDPNAVVPVATPNEVAVAAVGGGTVVGEVVGGTTVAPVYGSPVTQPAPGATLTSRDIASTAAQGVGTSGQPMQAAVVGTPGQGTPAGPAITAGSLSQIRPADAQQRPDWTKHPARPKPAASLSVGGGPASDNTLGSLNEALAKLPAEGGVIRLPGGGPYPLSLTVPIKAKQVTLLGDPQAGSTVILVRGGEQDVGRLDVIGSLELSDVHLAVDRGANPAAAPLSCLTVQQGSLTLTNSSVNVLGTDGAPITAITMVGGNAPQTLTMRRTAIRGEVAAGLDLKTAALAAVIDESLISVGAGKALRFEGPSGLTPAGETSRWIRAFASTLAGRDCLVDFSPEQPLSAPPKTELTFKSVIGAAPPGAGNRSLLGVVDWEQQRVRDLLAWNAIDSTFVGFDHLIDLGGKSSFRADDADGWRQFWKRKAAPHEFVNEPWPADLGVVATAPVALYERETLPMDARQAGAGGELPGVASQWLSLPESLQADRLTAIAGRPMPPQVTEAFTGEPLKVDLKKQDLGAFLAQNEWPDGAIVEATGTGLCSSTPVSLSGKRLKLVFVQGEGGPLRVVPKESAASAPALFELRDGLLVIDGLRTDWPEARQKLPQAIVAVQQGTLIVTRSELRGPNTIAEPYRALAVLQSDASAQPGTLSIDRSVLWGAGPLIRATGGGGRLFLEDSLLSTNDRVLHAELQTHAGAIPFLASLRSNTFAAGHAVFQVDPASAGEPITRPARLFADHNVFLLGGPWKLPSQVAPTLLRCAGPVLDQTQLTWWGQGNGVAKEFPAWLTTTSGTARQITKPDEWTTFWGPGHDVKTLGGGDGVVLAAPLAARVDQLAPAQFALHPSCKGAVWNHGEPIGADVAALKGIGPQAVAAQPAAGKKPATPTPKPAGNKKPGF